MALSLSPRLLTLRPPGSGALLLAVLGGCLPAPSGEDRWPIGNDEPGATETSFEPVSAGATSAGADDGATPGDGTGGGPPSSGTATTTSEASPTSTGSTAEDTETGTPRPPLMHGKFVGNITTSGQVRPDFLQYWNQITPENEGKWGSVEAQRDVMDWSGLDRAYAFARENGIPFKQHVFVWGSQQPSWIAGLPADEQREEVEEWIRLYCERYPDTQLIDVVNEPPPHTTPPYMEALGGAGATGYDWIVWSFQTARRHCPNAILILNDYNVLRWDTANFLSIVEAVKDSGYIDAIGAQAHGLETQSVEELEANLDRLVATGLPVYISEYDLDIADDAEQQRVMQAQFPVFYETEGVVGITLWGYVHGATWRTETGLLRNGTLRPAMTWLMDYLGR